MFNNFRKLRKLIEEAWLPKKPLGVWLGHEENPDPEQDEDRDNHGMWYARACITAPNDQLLQENFMLKEKLQRWNTRISFTDIASLGGALIRAKDAHVKFESGLGRPDSNWPLWYASYIAMEQGLAVSSSLIPKPRCVGPSCMVVSQTSQPADKFNESLDTEAMSNESGHETEDEYWDVHGR